MMTVAAGPTPIPTAVPGVALFPTEFEEIIARLRGQIGELAAKEHPLSVAAPPVIGRDVLERAGYVAGFPQLLGTVHTFQSGPDAWRGLMPLAVPGGDWHARQAVTDVALTPAACYHVYPMLAGHRVEAPARFAVESHCYRHEETAEVGRLRSFRMRELVHVGSRDACLLWRNRWRRRVGEWITGLGLDVLVEVATDPFFGPAARLMRNSQHDQELKFEFRVPVADGLRQAIASCNYHKEHFGEAFGIESADRGPVHSACAAFGLERIAIALLYAHGGDAGSVLDAVPAVVAESTSA